MRRTNTCTALSLSLAKLRRNISTLITAIFWACIIVGILAFTATSKPDKIFEAGIIAVALFALLIASVQLDLMRREFNARVRPFVSFGEIRGEANRQIIESSTDSIELRIPIQNTGIIPADNLRVFTSTLAADTGQLINELESQAPKLAPNNLYNLNVQLSMPKTSSTILRLRVKYEGLGKSYDWEQKYRMQVERKTSGVYLSFIPTA